MLSSLVTWTSHQISFTPKFSSHLTSAYVVGLILNGPFQFKKWNQSTLSKINNERISWNMFVDIKLSQFNYIMSCVSFSLHDIILLEWDLTISMNSFLKNCSRHKTDTLSNKRNMRSTIISGVIFYYFLKKKVMLALLYIPISITI